MEKYDGSSGPVDHLKAFVDLMRLHVTPDAIIYRAFSPTLSSKRAKKTAIGIQLTHDKDERLKDFIAQFNRATLGIKDQHMYAIVTTMMSGTRSLPFKMSLSKNPLDKMHVLLRRMDKYVDVEKSYFITKGMKDRKEPESNKRKTQDEPKP
ncbi:Retrotransposon gag protein [Abeliophyllum distichum]|uniref:Retrotransposon gag protein n=1 Tax=Abeliophyllum distichum TaxID=126358 RepID=A0ABD1RDZ4_9LAMI